MATKKKTPQQHQRELVANMERSDETSQEPLVNLVIPRPEPMMGGAQLLLDRAQAFAITDADSYTQAANARQQIKAEYDAMEARRKKLKEPTLTAGREVDNLFNPPLDLLDQAIKTLSAGMKKYDDEQRAIAARKQREAEEEASRVRQAAELQARQQREHTQRCMERIQAINNQVVAAQQGNPNKDRKGGTLECIRETLAETEAAVIDKEKFGDLYPNAVQAKETAIAAIKALEANFLAKQEQERIAKEQEAARAAGDAEALRKAQEDAKVQRAAALEARKAELRAQEQQRKAEEQAKAAAAANEAQAQQLEQKAATTVAPKIEADLVQVNGLQRPKTWKWRLLDKKKIKDEFLLIDEKSINRLVSTAKERAAAMVGEPGAIEIYQDEGIRQ